MLQRIGWRPSREGVVERLQDVPGSVLAELNYACQPEIERLEAVSGVDLSAWRLSE